MKEDQRLRVMRALDGLARDVAKCSECRLSLTRTRTVFGAGNPMADLVVLGEGPGQQEDEQGVPFVGPAGKLQARMLQTIGRDRNSAYICNVVKCRACEEALDEKGNPIAYYRKFGGLRNRTPDYDEIAACKNFLRAQLNALPNKRLIVCMGSVPGHWMLADDKDEKRLSMAGMRGKFFATVYGPVMVTYHPSYLLRSPEQKVLGYNDLRRAESFLATRRTEDELMEMLRHPREAKDRTQTYSPLGSMTKWGLKDFQKTDPYKTELEVR